MCQHDRRQSKNGTTDGGHFRGPVTTDISEYRIYRDAETNGATKATALTSASFQPGGLAGRRNEACPRAQRFPLRERGPIRKRKTSYRLVCGETFHNSASALAASDTARCLASTDDEEIDAPARCTIGVLYGETFPVRLT